MAEELKSPRIEKTNPDWYSKGYPVLQGELELIGEGDVTIPASRYDALVRAEHTVELIERIYTDKALKYDCERTAVIRLLLGMETEIEGEMQTRQYNDKNANPAT